MYELLKLPKHNFPSIQLVNWKGYASLCYITSINYYVKLLPHTSLNVDLKHWFSVKYYVLFVFVIVRAVFYVYQFFGEWYRDNEHKYLFAMGTDEEKQEVINDLFIQSQKVFVFFSFSSILLLRLFCYI